MIKLPGAIYSAFFTLTSSFQDRHQSDIFREAAASTLHEYFENRIATHEQATKIVQDCWNRKCPFCLYLYNFDLGVKSSEPFFSKLSAQTEIYNILLNYEISIQSLLLENLKGQIPIVTLNNPSENRYIIPTIHVAENKWKRVVAELVISAHVIIVHYCQLTPGIIWELALLDNLKRNRDTIIIKVSDKHNSNDHIFENDFRTFLGLGSMFTSEDKAKEQSIIAKFPYVLDHDQTNDLNNTLISLLRELINRPITTSFLRTPHKLPLPKIINGFSRMLKKVKWAFCTWAGRVGSSKGNYEAAELLFWNALAASFWSENSSQRAESFFHLGRLQKYKGRNLHNAAHALRRAADIYKRLGLLISHFSSSLESADIFLSNKDFESTRQILISIEDYIPDMEPSLRFMYFQLAERLETSLNKYDSARDAREDALKSYNDFRVNGGLPMSPGAILIAKISDTLVGRDAECIQSLITKIKGIQETLPAATVAMIDLLSGIDKYSALRRDNIAPDEWWELNRLSDILQKQEEL